MKNERFNLITTGKIVNGLDRQSVIHRIEKLFSVNEIIATKIVNQHSQPLKNNISWRLAKQYSHKLEKIGLKIHTEVSFGPELFRDSLIPTGNTSNGNTSNLEPHPQLQAKLQPGQKAELQPALLNKTKDSFLKLSFTASKLIPDMFSLQQSENLLDKNNVTNYILKSFNFCYNPKFLLLASMITALLVQKYFTLLLVQTNTGISVTLISVIIFFIVFITLPKALTPMRIFSIRTQYKTPAKGNSAYLLCTQIACSSIIKNRYQVFSSNNIMLADITANKLNNHFECKDGKGKILFTSRKEYDMDDAAQDVAAQFRDQLYDFSFFAYLRIIKNYLNHINASVQNKEYVYKRSDVYVIRDRNAKKIAYFHSAKISTIELPSNVMGENESKILLAFTLVCAGIS